MEQSDLFAYLAAFVSIVIAVAVTDMIESAHRLIRAGQRVKWDLLTPLWALSIFLLLLWQFFGLWGDARFDRLTFNGLLALVATPAIYTFAAFAVLPDEVPNGGLDLRQFFFDNRRYVAVLMALAMIGDIIRSLRWLATHPEFDRSVFWQEFTMTFVGSSAALVLVFFARSWWLQLLAAVGFLFVTYWSSMHSYIEPVGQS